MNLNTTKALVKSILESNKETRNSDMVLYLEVVKAKNPNALNHTFGSVILWLDKYGIPPFESVRRSRQKVQAECPWLAASEKVQDFRAENEQTFKDFARG
jgi:hypothetical protein